MSTNLYLIKVILNNFWFFYPFLQCMLVSLVVQVLEDVMPYSRILTLNGTLRATLLNVPLWYVPLECLHFWKCFTWNSMQFLGIHGLNHPKNVMFERPGPIHWQDNDSETSQRDQLLGKIALIYQEKFILCILMSHCSIFYMNKPSIEQRKGKQKKLRIGGG